MKYIFYFLFIVLLPIISCKKEPISEPGAGASPFYSQYVGNYYGIRSSRAVEFTSEIESDCILSTNVNGNELIFEGSSFSIPQTLPSSFSIGDLYYSGAKLDFYSNFDVIQSQKRYDAGITKVDLTFNGNKSSLPVTTDSEHPLKNQLEGTFILQIDKHEYLIGTDVSYVDTVAVMMSGYNVVIENKEYGIGKFYTYYKRNQNWNQGFENRDLYWVEDSLYLDYRTIPAANTGITDTIHHVFSGRKL